MGVGARTRREGAQMIAKVLVAFVPVVAFLALLVLMDSFKLARPSAIAKAMGWGVVAALVCDALYRVLTPALPLSAARWRSKTAPVRGARRWCR